MRALHKSAIFVFVFAFIGGSASAGERRTVVFASEKIMGQWVKSYFSSIAPEEPKFNACEDVVAKALTKGGFFVARSQFEPPQIGEARKFHTVFDRYGDISGMPNDLVVKAALIADPDAAVAVVCGAGTKRRKEKKGQPAAMCGTVVCEAIDAATKLRVAASADEKCLAGALGFGGSVAVAREVCNEAASELADELAAKYKPDYGDLHK